MQGVAQGSDRLGKLSSVQIRAIRQVDFRDVERAGTVPIVKPDPPSACACAKLQGLGAFDISEAGKSGAAGGAAGSALGPQGAAGGAAIGVGLYTLSESGASGVADPASGHSGAYLVDHPEARGGLSKAEAYRMAFRDLGARMWVNDGLQRSGNGFVAVAPSGARYDETFYVVEPSGWGMGPHELWLLSEWSTLGRDTLKAYRAHLYAIGKAPSWYAPSGADMSEEERRQANREAYDTGESGYWGDVLGSGGGSGMGGEPPEKRPQFVPTAAANRIAPMGDVSSSTAVWILGGVLVAGAAYLVLRKKGRR